MPAAPRSVGPMRRGVTLLELLVVLALAGILAGFALPAARRLGDAIAADRAAQAVVAAHRIARFTAIMRSRRTLLDVRADSLTVRAIQGADTVSLWVRPGPEAHRRHAGGAVAPAGFRAHRDCRWAYRMPRFSSAGVPSSGASSFHGSAASGSNAADRHARHHSSLARSLQPVLPDLVQQGGARDPQKERRLPPVATGVPERTRNVPPFGVREGIRVARDRRGQSRRGARTRPLTARLRSSSAASKPGAASDSAPSAASPVSNTVIPAARSGSENARRRSGSALITSRCREGMLRKVLARRRSAIRAASTGSPESETAAQSWLSGRSTHRHAGDGARRPPFFFNLPPLGSWTETGGRG